MNYDKLVNYLKNLEPQMIATGATIGRGLVDRVGRLSQDGRERLLTDVNAAIVNDDRCLGTLLAVDKCLPTAENLNKTLVLEKYGITGASLVDMLRNNAPCNWDYAHAFNDLAHCPRAVQQKIIAETKDFAVTKLANGVNLIDFARVYDSILAKLIFLINIRSNEIYDKQNVLLRNSKKFKQDQRCSRIAYFHYED